MEDRVREIIECEQSLEKDGYRAAELISAELSDGRSLRQVGDDIGKSHVHVLYMGRVWEVWGGNLGDQRPPFNEAYHSDDVRLGNVPPKSNAQRMQSSESNEWYTPARYIEAARDVLGGIDLDPASCELANQTVRAERFYSIHDDGLTQPWAGSVWLNPPYGGKGGSGLFVAKLVDSYLAGDVTAAVCLVSSHSADTEWFRPLWDHLLCFSYGRVPFISSSGDADAPTHGSVFAYLGKDWPAFSEEFGRFGAVVSRWQP